MTTEAVSLPNCLICVAVPCWVWPGHQGYLASPLNYLVLYFEILEVAASAPRLAACPRLILPVSPVGPPPYRKPSALCTLLWKKSVFTSGRSGV